MVSDAELRRLCEWVVNYACDLRSPRKETDIMDDIAGRYLAEPPDDRLAKLERRVEQLERPQPRAAKSTPEEGESSDMIAHIEAVYACDVLRNTEQVRAELERRIVAFAERHYDEASRHALVADLRRCILDGEGAGDDE